MTPTRTDDDLERLLRATLDARATTVSAGPGWTAAPDARARRRWIAPLVAAALVLALVATFVAFRTRGTDSRPATPPAHATTDLTAFPTPGYPVGGMLVTPSYRAVAVRTPGGVTGKDKADAIVFDFGAHGDAFNGFRSQARITVAGHPGFRGTAPAIQQPDGRVATVVWNYLPGRLAVVQSVAGQRAPTTATLLRVAGAAEPTGHLTIATAFRFTAVPAGFRFDQAEVISGVQAVIVSLRNARGVTLTVTSTSVHSQLAEGLPATDVIRHGDLLLVVNASEPKAPPTAADKTAATQLRAHLVWEQSTLDHVVP